MTMLPIKSVQLVYGIFRRCFIYTTRTTNQHPKLRLTFSLFAADPGVQTKYFGHMKTDADLEKHGVRVMNAIGAMVRAILDEDDNRLIGKIHEVCQPKTIYEDIVNVQ